MQERIVNKSHELFMRYGVRSISMDEIASHLGISKKTIYQYFADKDTLVEAFLAIEINRTECESVLHKKQSENAVHEVFLAMDMMEELFTNFNPSLIYDLEKYHPKQYKKFQDHHYTYLYDVIKENIERGIHEENYRTEVNADIMSRFRLASLFAAFNSDYFPAGKYSLAKVVGEITYNFLYGLTTQKGQALIQKYKQQRFKQLSL